MAKSHKQQKPGGEVLRSAKEITQLEQYWHVLGRAEPRKPPKDYGLCGLAQLELIKLQEWVHLQGLRLCVLFEGRDAAGKGGVIKRITQSLQSARLPRSGFGHAYRKGTRPVVFPALCGNCPHAARSCSSTGAGTTAPASSE